VEAKFPEKLDFLFTAARYKIAYGGRGGAKSWGMARALVILGRQKPLRILCAREIQKSIGESVHQLLVDSIKELGLETFYSVTNNEIRGLNGTLIIFAGLRHNVDNIKSKEGIDICWVEEASNVSSNSWNKLIPTIRKDGSEIWISFNPELDTDETYRRFVLTPPPSSIVVKLNWSDNPWFPETLRAEKDHLKDTDPDAYMNVYEGHCKAVLDGAILAKEIRAATEANRITRVPYDRTKPVMTAWDLGRRDLTSIWFWQTVGYEHRFIDFYQNRGFDFTHFLGILQQKAMDKGYIYERMYLPHDADNDLLAASKTIAHQARDAGHKVSVMPRIAKKALGINAIRGVFSRCYFDEVNTADGLNALRRWRFDVDETTGQWSQEPLHDDNSHAADGFQTFAQGLIEAPKRKPLNLKRGGEMLAQGWMR
jgi:phage terminase large subunit